MPEHPEGHQIQLENNNEKIRIFQINLNKSQKAHLEVINERVSQNYDIMLIQEPYTTIFNGVRTPTNFRPVFPSHRIGNDEQIRSVIWINNKLDTNNWEELNIPGTSV